MQFAGHALLSCGPRLRPWIQDRSPGARRKRDGALSHGFCRGKPGARRRVLKQRDSFRVADSRVPHRFTRIGQ
ncbi:hypothetical protein NMD1_01768 [Novosphingobium sp. MD-1]|nr:hypothetical protein NMD1_01768 [Novosphingobium sp. MD-1]